MEWPAHLPIAGGGGVTITLLCLRIRCCKSHKKVVRVSMEMTYLPKHWELLNIVVKYEPKESIIHHDNISILWRIVLFGNL